MKKLWLTLICFVVIVSTGFAQQILSTGHWLGMLHRQDGHNIVFDITINYNKQYQLTVTNADEKIALTNVHVTKDSLFFSMPVFESEFKARIVTPDSLNGNWVKGTSAKNQIMAFTATANNATKFKAVLAKPQQNISGKWAVTFSNTNGRSRNAIALFKQQGHKLTGSFVTPTGDYRYLDGNITGDSIMLSTFDGVHAFLFSATVTTNNGIKGTFYNGPVAKETWLAQKNDTATLPDLSAMFLKDEDDSKLNFSFLNLKGEPVSINDAAFKNKVVVVQLMGSWCPNCMDETQFLSNWYKQNKSRGVEVVALAYEYSTDFERSRNSVSRFQQKFKVEYPMLITGVAVSDTLRTEKTLPQLTQIKTFPTTIILDKKGNVRKIETDFSGPGTGSFFEAFKKEFNQTINALLLE